MDDYCEIRWAEGERPGDFNDYDKDPAWPDLWDHPGCGPTAWMDEADNQD